MPSATGYKGSARRSAKTGARSAQCAERAEHTESTESTVKSERLAAAGRAEDGLPSRRQ